MKFFLLIHVMLSGLAASADSFGEDDDANEQQKLSNLAVMSFNIRYGTANDGRNTWPRRHQLVVETIKQFDPDILGVQEALHFQAAHLQAKLQDYTFHGAGRDDGRKRGEYTGIFYRTERFEKLDADHFWLSESPKKPGSVSWDSSMTRMASWIKLKDKQTNRICVFINTHFDHRGRRARVESAKLIRELADKQEKDAAIIIVGDFNASEDSEPYKVFIRKNEDHAENQRLLVDTFRVAHPEKRENEGTFGGFSGRTSGERIDWILCDQSFDVVSAMIDRHNDDDRYPSDHYPVNAVLRWKSQEHPSDK